MTSKSCRPPSVFYYLAIGHFLQCARTLGMCCYVSAAEDGEVRINAFCYVHLKHVTYTFLLPHLTSPFSFLYINTNASQDLVKSLTLLENVFMASYPNKEGTLPTPKPGSPGLHSAALQAWSLLVTLCPASKLSQLLDL